MPPSAFRPMKPGWTAVADALAEAQRNEPLNPVEHTPHSQIDPGDNAFLYQFVPVQVAAKQFAQRGLLETAVTKYKEAIPILVGNGFEVPLPTVSGGGLYSEKYVEMPLFKRTALMQACNDIGQFFMKTGDDEEALRWFLEVSIIYKNAHLHDKNEVLFDWFDINIPLDLVYLERIKALVFASNVFLKLGNTSMGAHRRAECTKIVFGSPPGFNIKCLEGMDWKNCLERLPTLRHPDPKLSLNLNIQCKELQAMGSWLKIQIPSDKNIQRRSDFASFVWNGRYYVAGGEKSMGGPFFRDIRYIVLSDLEAGWHFHLPSYPIRKSMGGRMSNWSICVDDNKAYIFNGSPVVDYFDLVAEQWSSIKTKFPASLNGPHGPWPVEDLQDYSMVAYDGKLYVFGGTYERCEVGQNTLLELDLKTHGWRRLSGYPGPKLTAEYTCPGPRRYASMWVDKRVSGGEKIYLLYGDADRVSAKQGGQVYGASGCYAYDDLWSWDIRKEVWRRERIDGNPPCPRSEMGCTFNEKLGMTILFGGYSPTLETYLPEQKKCHSFTYFGDTFLYIPPSSSPSPSSERPKFKQVITRGFPTYRAGAHLFTDPATGKVYLFGGYTNSQLIPEPRDDAMRSYADLWQLRLDVPGGHFEDANLEEDARTARVGPWQRCFNCGNAGPWKKCGGMVMQRPCILLRLAVSERWLEGAQIDA
ncbi:unnamed protein product [Somion occarium]|uniref:Kelch repeat-containing protein n=1 Tax=Somion occarium TaxID=3059160 RepID=A0ABP1CZY7_9APHY